jgi:hypothetical protein
MNLRYNTIAGRFEAEFSTDFAGDLAAVKASGFRCEGPPSWVWHTSKIPSLDKLRANRPVSGLTITNEALVVYQRLSEIERKNAEARAQFAPLAEKQKEEKEKAKKERRKQKHEEQTYVDVIIPDKPGELYGYIGKDDLSVVPPHELKNPPLPHTGPWCFLCKAPVYFYELQDPPTCLFCETKSLTRV